MPSAPSRIYWLESATQKEALRHATKIDPDLYPIFKLFDPRAP
jgi:hypothetical protein